MNTNKNIEEQVAESLRMFLSVAKNQNINISHVFKNLNILGFTEDLYSEYTKLTLVSELEKNALYELCNIGKGKYKSLMSNYDLITHILENRGHLIFNSVMVNTMKSNVNYRTFIANIMYSYSSLPLNKKTEIKKVKFDDSGVETIINEFMNYCTMSARNRVYLENRISKSLLVNGKLPNIQKYSGIHSEISANAKKNLKEELLHVLNEFKTNLREGNVFKEWLIAKKYIDRSSPNIKKEIDSIDFNSYSYENLVALFTNLISENIVAFLNTINYITSRLSTLYSMNKNLTVIIFDKDE